MRVRIYAEGGGEGQLLDTLFRQGWSEFFKTAGLEGRMPRVVRGKSRERTFDLFSKAVKTAKQNELPLLLVDSEGPVAAGHSPWQHLKDRDDWNRPRGASKAQAFLMVQLMETWFLSDRDLLSDYFGAGLRRSHLREWTDLESVSKDKILNALRNATAGCRRPYSKGRASYELLGRLNPRKVEEKCPHGKALLDRLRSI